MGTFAVAAVAVVLGLDLLGSSSADRGATYEFSRGHGLLDERERRSR